MVPAPTPAPLLEVEMKVIYQGITKEAQEKQLDQHMASIDPPEKAAQELYYHIDNRDNAMQAREKDKRTAKWMADQKVVKIKELEDHDAAMHLRGFVFKKGEVVDVPDESDLITAFLVVDGVKKKVRGKMFALIEQGEFKQAEEDKEAEELPTTAEVEAETPHKRGRPKKAL